MLGLIHANSSVNILVVSVYFGGRSSSDLIACFPLGLQAQKYLILHGYKLSSNSPSLTFTWMKKYLLLPEVRYVVNLFYNSLAVWLLGGFSAFSVQGRESWKVVQHCLQPADTYSTLAWAQYHFPYSIAAQWYGSKPGLTQRAGLTLVRNLQPQGM